MYFVIRKSKDFQYYFLIKSNNHEIVATSEMYYTKSSALETINSIKKNVNATSQIIDISNIY